MATVDIEPASLAVTPGESELLTLTIRNDGDDVEAYHLTVVDDAAGYVVIEPDTLLVRPGETVTAEATLTLAHTGKWRLGDLIVRFHIVPAGHPDEFLVVEAIATIQSFSDVAAVLSPPGALEGRRSAAAEVTIANAGNAHTYAEVSASAGELAVFINQPHAALPAGSTERVQLSVRARSLLWRGEPVEHPFAVTVTPEGGQAISLEGTFTQLPIFARWARAAAIAVGAVAVAAVLVGVGALALRSVIWPPPPPPSSSETTTPPPVLDVNVAVSSPSNTVRGGDPVTFTLEPDVTGAPEGALLGMNVEWPEGLLFTDSDCEYWLLAKSEQVLKSDPWPGDECVVEASGAGPTATLNFSTPPAGLEDQRVTVTETRLLTSAGDGVEELETGPDSHFGTATSPAIDVPPYPFWMEVEDLGPSDWADAKVTIHHDMRGDGTDPNTTMAFDVGLPGFVGEILDTRLCDGRDLHSTICSVNFPSNHAETDSTVAIDMLLDVDEEGGVGLLTLTGTSVVVDGVAPAEDVDKWVQGAEGLLVSESLFDVNVAPPDVDAQPGQKDVVTAKISVAGLKLPAGVDTYSEGSWELTLKLDWPGGLVPDGLPDGCELVGQLCTLSLDPGEDREITMKFVVEDASNGGWVSASGDALSFDPTTDADREDGRTQPLDHRPRPDWIGSDEEWYPF